MRFLLSFFFCESCRMGSPAGLIAICSDKILLSEIIFGTDGRKIFFQQGNFFPWIHAGMPRMGMGCIAPSRAHRRVFLWPGI